MQKEKKLSPERQSMQHINELAHLQYMNGKGLDGNGNKKNWVDDGGRNFQMSIVEETYKFHQHSLITMLKQVTGMRLEAQRYTDISKHAEGRVKALKQIEQLLARRARLSTPWKKVKPQAFMDGGIAGISDTVWNDETDDGSDISDTDSGVTVKPARSRSKKKKKA